MRTAQGIWTYSLDTLAHSRSPVDTAPLPFSCEWALPSSACDRSQHLPPPGIGAPPGAGGWAQGPVCPGVGCRL